MAQDQLRTNSRILRCSGVPALLRSLDHVGDLAEHGRAPGGDDHRQAVPPWLT
jgi:hypothetical protein